MIAAALVCAAALRAAAAPGPDPKSVQEVAAGRLKTANAAWWGFDPADGTKALQAALRSGAKVVVVPDMGRPWLVEPLFLESGVELRLEPGVELAAKPGAFRDGHDSLLSIIDKKNVKITGRDAVLRMRKADYRKPPYAKAEWRHCVNILGSEAVELSGIRCLSSGGDGVYVGRTSEHPFSQDVRLADVVLEDHYRQAVSVISVDGLTLERVAMRGTEGTAPAAGIDFEPNHPDERLTRIRLKDCAVEKNAGSGILVAAMNLPPDGPPLDIALEGVRASDNRYGALRVVAGAARGRVRVRASRLDGKRLLSEAGAVTVEEQP